MSQGETGKQRAQRIELDYFRQRDSLARLKVALAITACLFGIAVFAYSNSNSIVAMPGPVAAGHAEIESNCEACHTPFVPIANDSIRELKLPPYVDVTAEKSVAATFSKCTHCHNGEHPIAGHHNHQLAGDWKLADENCALCHADHQGRLFDLSDVQNERCVDCHRRIDSVCLDPSQTVLKDEKRQSIVAFSKQGHSEFASLFAGDPGRIKFDHAQHLLPGQSAYGAAGKVAMTADRLPDEFQGRYATNENGFVQLACKDCHQSSGVADEGIGAVDKAGRYMTPINFEQHCSACHCFNPAGQTAENATIPHAAAWDEVGKWLDARLAIKKREQPSSGPTGIGTSTERSGSLTIEQLDAFEKSTAIATLQQQCFKCHVDDVTTDKAVAATKLRGKMIPSRWLTNGQFDHASHQKVDCLHCHGAVVESDPKLTAKDHTVVAIGGIETCTGCHRPAGTTALSSESATFGGHTQWASDRCVLCHRYHNTPSTTLGADR